MNINQEFPSKYLKSDADFPGDEDLILTIRDVKIENVGQEEEHETKPIIYFDEVKKGLVLNVTNKNTIVGLHGIETDNWIGKKITLYVTEVEFKGKMTLGIRVRLRAPKAQAQPAGNGGNGTGQERKVRQAVVKTAAWFPIAEELAASYPQYQDASGKADHQHLWATAGSLGVSEITDANLDDVVNKIVVHAASKATA